eukprot:366332-Chlamydomonas_euryale.AAC.16
MLCARGARVGLLVAPTKRPMRARAPRVSRARSAALPSSPFPPCDSCCSCPLARTCAPRTCQSSN